MRPGLLPASVAGVVLAVSLVLGASAWRRGDALFGVFLGAVAVLGLVQAVHHFRRFMRG